MLSTDTEHMDICTYMPHLVVRRNQLALFNSQRILRILRSFEKISTLRQLHTTGTVLMSNTGAWHTRQQKGDGGGIGVGAEWGGGKKGN